MEWMYFSCKKDMNSGAWGWNAVRQVFASLHTPTTHNSCIKTGFPVIMFGNRAFGSWLGHESRTLKNGINAFITENSLTPATMWRCSKKKKKKSRARFIASMNIPGPYQTPNWCCLVLGLLDSRNMRNRSLLVHMPPSLWYSIIAARMN